VVEEAVAAVMEEAEAQAEAVAAAAAEEEEEEEEAVVVEEAVAAVMEEAEAEAVEGLLLQPLRRVPQSRNGRPTILHARTRVCLSRHAATP
jgi:hypothetical protein